MCVCKSDIVQASYQGHQQHGAIWGLPLAWCAPPPCSVKVKICSSAATVEGTGDLNRPVLKNQAEVIINLVPKYGNCV